MTGAAYVVMRDGHVLEAAGRPCGRGTNQSAELRAAIYGIDAVFRNTPRGEDILLVSDSEYLLSGLRTCDNNSPVKPNSKLWDQLYEKLTHAKNRGSVLRTYWVKGHGGNPGNESCDKLAKEAARTKKEIKYGGRDG